MRYSLCVLKTCVGSRWPVLQTNADDATDLTLDIWWIIEDGGLLLLLPHLLRQHELWSKSRLRIFGICDDKKTCRREADLARQVFTAEAQLQACEAGAPCNRLEMAHAMAMKAWKDQQELTNQMCEQMERRLQSVLADLHIPVTSTLCVPAYEIWWARQPRTARRDLTARVESQIKKQFEAGVRLSNFETNCRSADLCIYSRIKQAVELNQLVHSHSENSTAIFMALPDFAYGQDTSGCANASEYLKTLDALTHGMPKCCLIRGAREVVTPFV